jgi:exosome complex exonuclease DIS3/RRP44
VPWFLAAIRKAALWYNAYIKGHMRTQKGKGLPSVVLLTDDAENRRRAEKEGVPYLSGEHHLLLHYKTPLITVPVHSYVSRAKDSVKLLDVVASVDDASLDLTEVPVARRPALYPDVRKRCYPLVSPDTYWSVPQHLPTTTVLAAVRSGTLFQGYFAANPYNYLEVRAVGLCVILHFTDLGTTSQGTVNIPAFTKPVLLIGREHMNRSVDGDVVAVEIFPESEWKVPGDEVVDQDCTIPASAEVLLGLKESY